jgi:hypothetical protein
LIYILIYIYAHSINQRGVPVVLLTTRRVRLIQTSLWGCWIVPNRIFGLLPETNHVLLLVFKALQLGWYCGAVVLSVELIGSHCEKYHHQDQEPSCQKVYFVLVLLVAFLLFWIVFDGRSGGRRRIGPCTWRWGGLVLWWICLQVRIGNGLRIGSRIVWFDGLLRWRAHESLSRRHVLLGIDDLTLSRDGICEHLLHSIFQNIRRRCFRWSYLPSDLRPVVSTQSFLIKRSIPVPTRSV